MATDIIHSDLAIPPGEYLEEVLVSLGMTKDELARRMARPASKLSPIFKGRKSITPDTALQLEKVLGVPAHIWLGLESEYRLTLARQDEIRENQKLQEEAALLPKFCYSELARIGMVAKIRRKMEKVQELQRFFAVASLDSVVGLRRYQAAFRCAGTVAPKDRAPLALAAWLRVGEIRAQAIPCRPYEKVRLKGCMGDLRAMTKKEPEQFQEELVDLLSRAGVALVILPHFRGTRAHGATFWLGREKAVAMVTIRGSWADIFWFSLFHELGHILLHDRQEVFIEDECSSASHRTMEEEANRFAAEQLIPPNEYNRFVAATDYFPDDAVISFANRIGIHPGVVVGRLQHDGHLRPEWGNGLRNRYKWAPAKEASA